MVWAGRDDLSDFTVDIDAAPDRDGNRRQLVVRHMPTGLEYWIEPEKHRNQYRDGEIYFLFGPGPDGDWLARVQSTGDGPSPLEEAEAAGIVFKNFQEKDAYVRAKGRHYLVHRPVEAVDSRMIPWDEDLVRLLCIMFLISTDRPSYVRGGPAPLNQVRFAPSNLPKRLHRTLSTSERGF